MLTNENYNLLAMAKIRIDFAYNNADSQRMTSLLRKKKPYKPVNLILEKTGKVLIDAGNRLLKIA